MKKVIITQTEFGKAEIFFYPLMNLSVYRYQLKKKNWLRL